MYLLSLHMSTGCYPIKVESISPGTCKTHSSTGSCQRGWKCFFRHPIGSCHQWRNTGECMRGFRCIFRHPSEMLQQNFLGLPRTQNQHPPIQKKKITQNPEVLLLNQPTTPMILPTHLFTVPPPPLNKGSFPRIQ